ncbi:thiazole synthase [Gallaecimonas sp. GXIMD4217]|uniref:thiazole synthase n=1 Tax=Gallaecimonas sp. GXIMD4217 TaxID=3131927 RepID=UPI00311AD7CF
MDALHLYGHAFRSRLWLGTAAYPSPTKLQAAVQAAEPGLLTCSLRRQRPDQEGGQAFWAWLKGLALPLLPNTAGCHSAKEAINLAWMARELFDTPWIKLEITGDDYNLQPDPFALVEACRELTREGFQVFPYCTTDLVLCKRLLDAGCEVLMPWGAPIGSGQGLNDILALKTLRQRLPGIPLVVDAGIGLPSQACHALELGMDAVLLNTAVARAGDPALMAAAMAGAVSAGRQAFLAQPMSPQDRAAASTPIVGTPFWHGEH